MRGKGGMVKARKGSKVTADSGEAPHYVYNGPRGPWGTSLTRLMTGIKEKMEKTKCNQIDHIVNKNHLFVNKMW
ncbi:MAG: hypothetical protein ACI81P_002449 [Neolewinella sp.]|jgi:hypothetical protein